MAAANFSELARFFKVCPRGTVEWSNSAISECNLALYMNGALLPADLGPAYINGSGGKISPLLRHKDRLLVRNDDADGKWKYAIFFKGVFEHDCSILTEDQINKSPFAVTGRQNLLTFEKFMQTRTRIGVYKYVGEVNLNWVRDITVKDFTPENTKVCSRGSECCVALRQSDECLLEACLVYFSRVERGRKSAVRKFKIRKPALSFHYVVTPFITADHFGAVVETQNALLGNEVEFAWFSKLDEKYCYRAGPKTVCKVPGGIAVTGCRSDSEGKNVLFVVDLVNYVYYMVNTADEKVLRLGPMFSFSQSATSCIRYHSGFLFAYQEKEKLRLKNWGEDRGGNFNVVTKNARLLGMTENGNVYIGSGGRCVSLHLSRFGGKKH